MINQEQLQNDIKKLKRVIISHFDFTDAKTFLELLLKNHSYTKEEKFGLETALIVSYSRPFSGNDRNIKNPVRDIKGILKQLNDEERTVHNYVLNSLRNKEYAHSDSDAHNVKFSVVQTLNIKMLIPIKRAICDPLTQIQLCILRSTINKHIDWLHTEQLRIQEVLPVGNYN